jgi:signal transduction histidine kinase
MNVASVIAVASASVALLVAVYALRLGRTPGWSAYRALAAIAIGSAAYALGNVVSSSGQPDAVVVAAGRFQLAGLFLELWGWWRFVEAHTGAAPLRGEPWVRRGLLAVAGLSLIPGLTYTGVVTGHDFAPWGASYRDAVPTAFGSAVFVGGLVASLWVLGKLFLAWRRGIRSALVHALALSVLFLLAVNDALVATGRFDAPYLLDVGFLVPLGGLFWAQGERLIKEATQLRALRDRLEALLAERNVQLAVANQSLHQAERFAELGRFAAGVAHRFNNPAAVVQSTLNQLHEAVAQGREPSEPVEALFEAREAMRRISSLVRQLTDAGRLATGPVPPEGCDVAAVLHGAVEGARARHPAGVRFFSKVPAGLRARIGSAELERVADALLSNAAQAAKRGQGLHVVVTGRPLEGNLVAVGVADDGVGMDEETLARAFDPFFTTRPEGSAAGLGLSVARALVEVVDGTLTLESHPGGGTDAWVVLPSVPPPQAEPPA